MFRLLEKKCYICLEIKPNFYMRHIAFGNYVCFSCIWVFKKKFNRYPKKRELTGAISTRV